MAPSFEKTCDRRFCLMCVILRCCSQPDDASSRLELEGELELAAFSALHSNGKPLVFVDGRPVSQSEEVWALNWARAGLLSQNDGTALLIKECFNFLFLLVFTSVQTYVSKRNEVCCATCEFWLWEKEAKGAVNRCAQDLGGRHIRDCHLLVGARLHLMDAWIGWSSFWSASEVRVHGCWKSENMDTKFIYPLWSQPWRRVAASVLWLQ